MQLFVTPIVSLIKKDRNITTILDVGSGALGITPYLKRKATGLDASFHSPTSPLLQKILRSADKIPFPENSFDAVICVDVLEHIPSKRRHKVIKELIRVTKRKIFLVCPCDKDAEKEDKIIEAHVKKIFKTSDPFLNEHLTYGLPMSEKIMKFIPANCHVKIYHLTNIHIHRLILKTQFTRSRMKNLFHL